MINRLDGAHSSPSRQRPNGCARASRRPTTCRSEPQWSAFKGWLVDVVQLRKRGERLDRDEVRTAQPLRGVLWITCKRPGFQNYRQTERPLTACLYKAGTDHLMVEPLHPAKVCEITGRGMLIIGQQQRAYVRERLTDRQAWWCRLVPSA